MPGQFCPGGVGGEPTILSGVETLINSHVVESDLPKVSHSWSPVREFKMIAFLLAASAGNDGRELQAISAWHKNVPKGSEFPVSEGIQARSGQHSKLSSNGKGAGWRAHDFIIIQVYLLGTGTANVQLCICTSSRCFFLKLTGAPAQDCTCRSTARNPFASTTGLGSWPLRAVG